MLARVLKQDQLIHTHKHAHTQTFPQPYNFSKNINKSLEKYFKTLGCVIPSAFEQSSLLRILIKN